MNPIVAMASEVDFSALTAGFSVLTSAISSVWDVMTSNPLTLAFVASSVAGIGFGLIRKAKKTAK